LVLSIFRSAHSWIVLQYEVLKTAPESAFVRVSMGLITLRLARILRLGRLGKSHFSALQRYFFDDEALKILLPHYQNCNYHRPSSQLNVKASFCGGKKPAKNGPKSMRVGPVAEGLRRYR
jgi:hypothetical protein